MGCGRRALLTRRAKHIAAAIESRRDADKQFGRRSAHAYNGETNDKIAEMRFFGDSHRRIDEHISAQEQQAQARYEKNIIHTVRCGYDNFY